MEATATIIEKFGLPIGMIIILLAAIAFIARWFIKRMDSTEAAYRDDRLRYEKTLIQVNTDLASMNKDLMNVLGNTTDAIQQFNEHLQDAKASNQQTIAIIEMLVHQQSEQQQQNLEELAKELAKHIKDIK